MILFINCAISWLNRIHKNPTIEAINEGLPDKKVKLSGTITQPSSMIKLASCLGLCCRVIAGNSGDFEVSSSKET